MLLKEIAMQSNLKLKIKIEKTAIYFESEVIGSHESGIFTPVLMHKGKVLTFDKPELKFDILIMNQNDTKPYEWLDVKVKTIQHPESKIYYTYYACEKEVKELNRRDMYRIWLGIPGTAQLGSNTKGHEIIVKDLSATGVGFICNKSNHTKIGSPVNVIFADEETGTKFNLGAQVVRIDELNDFDAIYGCILNKESHAICNYINTKQQLRLKGKQPMCRNYKKN